MESWKRVQSKAGMTMIEMTGVLGVTAILAALLVPKVFQIIAESRAEALASAIHTYESAIATYYSDVGTVWPLNAQGLPQAEGSGNSATGRSLAARLTLSSSDPLVLTTNLWLKFHGPYLEKFDSTHPPQLGTAMYLPARKTVPFQTTVTGSNVAWDLKGDDGKSDLPTNAHVACFKLQGIGERDFLLLDTLLDHDIGDSPSEKKVRGRAKWDPSGNGTAFIYLAHR